MAVIESRIDPNGKRFIEQREQNLGLLAEVRKFETKVRENSNKQKPKFDKRGQLLPRERVERLLDRGAPFLELSTLAGLRMHDDDGHDGAAGGGTITGIGFVEGTRCMVTASDSAIKGGAVTPMGLRKSLRGQEIALDEKLPMITLAESAGANLNYQSEIFVDGGRIFYNMARLSAAGLPQITVVHGSSTAGGAYLPGLSDYVVMIRGGAKVFLAGPPLVRAATGEIATDEELGGAEMHASVTGSAEYLAEDDAHGIALARDIVRAIDWNRHGERYLGKGPAPRYSGEELLGVVPSDYRQPYDVREVVARIVDDSEFLEFKALYGVQTVCGHARIEGMPVGIIGNNGPIYADGATKAGQFIQLCCQSGTPIVFLQNTTGYMVGKDAEHSGIIKHGAKMIQAVSNATVPRITINLGGSFGAGNYGMSGRAFEPRFCFAWPNSRIAVMGGEQAARVLSMITEEKYRKMGVEVDASVLDKLASQVKDKIDKESTALYATARIWDDGIIDPRDTRRVLAMTLATCFESEKRRVRTNSFGIARM